MTGAVNAQVLTPYERGGAPYRVASDMPGPMAAMPLGAAGYRGSVLPPPELNAVVRGNGFAPLGAPRLRGAVYTVSVIDPDGDDGRLVIDAHSGRIISFMPADRLGDNLDEDLTRTYGPLGPPLPIRPVTVPPRPPTVAPRLASRAPVVPLPKPAMRPSVVPPQAATPLSEPPQRAAAAQTSAQPAAPVAPAPAVAEMPASPIRPTQPMPEVQGLD
jgi:hypothetical protein